MPMYLASLATAVPPYVYSQQQCLEAIRSGPLAARLRPRSMTLLERVLGSDGSGIDQRHFAAPAIEPLLFRHAQALNEEFERQAPDLAATALDKALANAGANSSEIDALLVCTCTGYLCPGVSSHLAERLGLRPDVILSDLTGQGCGAALPAMRAAGDILAANPGALVAVVAVEISSAAFYADDDPGVLISLCLFGDGAAASLWRGRGDPCAWQAGRFVSLHRPEHREKIRFVNAGGQLKNQLHRDVPAVAAEAVSALFAKRSADPDQAITHGGGRDVIESLEAVLPFRLHETREVLRDHGNMSSPSVLFALERRLQSSTPGQRLWLASFGAGFTAHACELWRETTARG